MCSNEPAIDLARRLSSVIDAVAAAAGAAAANDAEPADDEVAARLAAAWALIAEADPELAERTARY
jgi:hypothetical protein